MLSRFPRLMLNNHIFVSFGDFRRSGAFININLHRKSGLLPNATGNNRRVISLKIFCKVYHCIALSLVVDGNMLLV